MCDEDQVFFRGRRNICRSWRVAPAAPRIVLDVSCVTRINHKSHSSPPSQHSLELDGGSCCSARCTGRFMSDQD